MLKRPFRVVCPYCGYTTTVECDSLYDDMKIAYCDYVEGGCNKYFAVKFDALIRVKTLAIEGESNNGE